MGILKDNELLLLEDGQGKRVLRSLQLPTDVSEPDRLLNYLWDAGLDSVWVMPATTLSRAATCSWLEQASSRWVVRVHPDPQEPSRPIRAQLWPRKGRQREARRLALVCWLLGTSVRKIGKSRQYNRSHLPSCLHEKLHGG